MSTRIHPLADVSPLAILADDVEIGAFASIAGDVELGQGCVVMPHAVILSGVRLGPGCQVHSGAVVGGDPQNRAYTGERTFLVVGARTILREYVTVSRATHGGETVHIGADCFLMAGSHVGHDCTLGDGVTMANAVHLAGHCQVGDRAVLGGATAVHQFVRIGRLAMVGGGSGVTRDAPPFMLTAGTAPAVVYGLNQVGLARADWAPGAQHALKQAFRLLYRSDLNVSQAVARIQAEVAPLPEIAELLAFIGGSQRGLSAGSQQRRRRGELGTRGGTGMGR
jgi:UDP-N-acetylglucosamine acyltransferase